MKDSWDITLGGEPYEINRYNSTYYTFLGKTMLNDLEVDASTLDHVFLQHEPEDGQVNVVGTYIFKLSKSFLSLADFINENNFPQILNYPTVPDCDKDAYMKVVDQLSSEMIEDHIPDDWV